MELNFLRDHWSLSIDVFVLFYNELVRSIFNDAKMRPISHFCYRFLIWYFHAKKGCRDQISTKSQDKALSTIIKICVHSVWRIEREKSHDLLKKIAH